MLSAIAKRDGLQRGARAACLRRPLRALFAVIVPASVLVGHRHSRTQQKTEARNLTHLNPYIDRIVPDSKELLFSMADIRLLDYMLQTAGDADMRARILRFRRAYERVHNGEPATEAMRDGGIARRRGVHGRGRLENSACAPCAQGALLRRGRTPLDGRLRGPRGRSVHCYSFATYAACLAAYSASAATSAASSAMSAA